MDEPLIDSSAASPAEPSPSLRPVEEIERDLAEDVVASVHPRGSYGPLKRLAADVPALLARLRAAEETLAAVERLAAIYERTAEVDPTGEFRKRAIDIRAALAEGASR